MNRIPSDISLEIEQLRDGKTTLDTEPVYSGLVKDKRIAIVGPARTLLGQRQGRFIDSHDIVVRINDVMEHLPAPHDLAEDFGTRADVIYCNQVILRKNILAEKGMTHEQFYETCAQTGVKSFVCTNNSLSYDPSGNPLPSCPKSDRAVITDFRRLLDKGNSKTTLRVVYGASEVLMRWLRGNWGRTGFVAILDLLGFGVRQLTVAGMTFYHGGGHLFAPESAVIHPQKNRDGSSSISSSGQGHDSFMELEVMRLLMKSYQEKLTVDDQLARLLGSEHPSTNHSVPLFS